MHEVKILSQTDFPSDHSYFRSGTQAFLKTLKVNDRANTYLMKNGVNFGWRDDMYWPFPRYIFERTEEEPDIKWLKEKYGWFHGLVIWIPVRRKEIPSWWKSSSYSPHFSEMGLTYLREDYWKSWDYKVRWSRRHKFFELWGEVRLVSNDEYFRYFCEFPDPYPFKEFSINQYRGIATYWWENLRNYVAFLHWVPVAGLSAYDYWENKQSTFHFLVFTRREYYSSQAWTALVDIWFQDSLKIWVKYIDFDRLMKPGWPKNQVWYTIFKHHFIDVHFHFDAYSKWF
jgi:hypothetical protein